MKDQSSADPNRFSNRNELAQARLMQDMERSVCGCNYGATSWTTKEEVTVLKNLMELKTASRVLDIGSGSGWPALLIAQDTGCQMYLSDIPVNGLKIAHNRALLDDIAGYRGAIAATGSELPFRPNSFDVLHHADVLCCLPDKTRVLEACRRVVAKDGKMVFSVIHMAEGLSQVDEKFAVSAGPLFVATEAPYEDLLTQTGWETVSIFDRTAAFAASARQSSELHQENAVELSRVIGRQETQEEIKRLHSILTAIEQGLLCRSVFEVIPVNGKE